MKRWLETEGRLGSADEFGWCGCCHNPWPVAPPLGKCIGCQVLRLRCLLVLHGAAGRGQLAGQWVLRRWQGAWGGGSDAKSRCRCCRHAALLLLLQRRGQSLKGVGLLGKLGSRLGLCGSVRQVSGRSGRRHGGSIPLQAGALQPCLLHHQQCLHDFQVKIDLGWQQGERHGAELQGQGRQVE